MKFLKRHKKVVLLILLLSLTVGPLALKKAYDNRFAIAQSPAFAHMIPLYRSLRKLPDIFTVPLYAFTDSNLETINLSISPANIQRMNEALPDDPFGYTALDEQYKLWVSADFSAAGYNGKVDVRYRGNLNGHWNSYKKSYLIKFPKDNLYNGMRELTLIIPDDRRYFTTALNNYRARKLGITVPDDYYLNMNVNGANHGVYLAFEHWSQEWVERIQLDPSSVLIGTGDDVSLLQVPFYSEEGSQTWKSWTSEEVPPFEFAKAVVEIIGHADSETFEKLIPQVADVEQFLARDTLSILSGLYHTAGPGSAMNNLILYFDSIEGRLKPVPYNVSLLESGGGQGTGQPTGLQRRLWDTPKFLERRSQIFTEYVKNEKQNDLDFLDEWEKTMNHEFYRDNAKAVNNFTYRKDIKLFRSFVEEYFDDPADLLGTTAGYSMPEVIEQPLVFEDSYIYLLDTIQTPQEFVKKHPQFFVRGDSIVLPAGRHFFAKDIVVPVSTKLVISPGATLTMREGVSLVSYSPVEAVGTQTRPIRITGNSASKWGTFAVINTEENQSVFEYTQFQNGSDDKINGVYFSGMLSLYNAHGMISNSSFMNAGADDGVNVKRGEVIVSNNMFEKNSSDAIDLDFGEGETIVSKNVFIDNGGDAIDLSWSDIAVEENIIIGCPDKGISVGESSAPSIVKNTIIGCNMGIAVKDLSEAEIQENILISNSIAVTAYQKKPIFGGGKAVVSGGYVWDNTRVTRIDAESEITIENDVIQDKAPDLTYLPENILNRINSNE